MRGSPTLLPEGVNLPGLEADDDLRFSEPWQAQAFALTVSLNESGVFTWTEWADVFSTHLGQADAAADGGDYFHHWVAALVELLEQKDVAAADQVVELTAAWQRAAHATPHGEPIKLENADP